MSRILATIGRNPKLVLGLIAISLFLINAVEWKMCRNNVPEEIDELMPRVAQLDG